MWFDVSRFSFTSLNFYKDAIDYCLSILHLSFILSCFAVKLTRFALF